MMRRTCPIALGALLLGTTGCAQTAPPHAETPARVKDSAPEKIAAQRAAIPGLNLEQEDQRWGIDAAKQRKQAAPPETPSKTPAATGDTKAQPADVKKPQ